MGDFKEIVSVSGGKDSAATRLIAIEHDIEHIAVFADTGNEHPLTYEWLDYFEDQTGEIIRVKADFSKKLLNRIENLTNGTLREKWIKEGVSLEKITQVIEILQPTGNPFLDLCLLKGRFPSTRARFCSEETKHFPIRQQVIDPLLDAGHEIISWQGVRRDESAARLNLAETETIDEGLHVYRPILDWTADDVFKAHKKHNLKPNPLYKLGMGRVGCMPCIHARKNEIKEISMRFPEEMERIARWELMVGIASKRYHSSFFAADKTPQGRKLLKQSRGGAFPAPLIFDVIEWSKTDRSSHYDMFSINQPSMCSSIYGLCE